MTDLTRTCLLLRSRTPESRGSEGVCWLPLPGHEIIQGRGALHSHEKKISFASHWHVSCLHWLMRPTTPTSNMDITFQHFTRIFYLVSPILLLHTACVSVTNTNSILNIMYHSLWEEKNRALSISNVAMMISLIKWCFIHISIVHDSISLQKC